MASEESEKKCFTFLWKLENISYSLQKKGERIQSPAFVVDAIENTKWELWLYPRGVRDDTSIGFFLRRSIDSEGAEKVEIEYELAFTTKDGSVLKSCKKIRYAFLKGQGYGYDKFAIQEEVFTSRRSEFLPEDTLTARVRIWKVDEEMPVDVRCYARTRIGVQKRSFLWNLENFSTLEPEKKYTYHLKSIKTYEPIMSVDLTLTGGLRSGDIIHFELSLQDEAIKYCTLQLFLIDAYGNKSGINQDEFWFNAPEKSKQFTFNCTKMTLLALKSLCLPGDVLSLHYEWAFSKGVVFEEIEEVECGSIPSENKILDVQKVTSAKNVPIPHALTENLKSLYDEHFLSDVNLKTRTSSFPAHKFILSASSSVFKAMFSYDMKEKNNDSVNIEDLSDDTIRRMLLYIYTARMENVTWESASHLYVAADKYAILSLKNICSSYLKDNLSPSSACEILLLADLHVDDDLKSAVQDYILKHDKVIINSDEWKLLMESNSKLAADTLCLRYK